MTLLKNNLVPVLIIIAAAALIVVLALPLAGTEWAESFRTAGEISSGSELLAEEGGSAPGIIMVIGPIVKVAIFMGIGILFTALGRGLSKRLRTSKNI